MSAVQEAQAHIRGLQKKLNDAQKKVFEFGTLQHQWEKANLNRGDACQHLPTCPLSRSPSLTHLLVEKEGLQVSTCEVQADGLTRLLRTLRQ